ncbi:MAG: sugar transferase [Bacteroidetes bacterium]|nr:sugar transferase [Bacteroidota bacterium]HET6244970.1 sugar transferase [Bacteroidia bacterium]
MQKRLFDIVLSLLGLIFLLPAFLIISLWIVFDSKGGIFYLQTRVGKNGKDFKLFKFRTMSTGADKKGLLTVGAKDSRITNAGYWLRKYKLDEFPQLLNVFLGQMSLVGPRPEVRKYVDLYSQDQLRVLLVKPGITDYASIEFSNENELLAAVENPDEYYINKIMPEKLSLNLKYINSPGLITDIKIILKTALKILK